MRQRSRRRSRRPVHPDVRAEALALEQAAAIFRELGPLRTEN